MKRSTSRPTRRVSRCWPHFAGQDLRHLLHRSERRNFGIYGLMGSGRSEIFDCLFGLDKPSSGEVKLFGAPLSVATPAQAIARGIALVTDDRKLSGLISARVRRNLSMASLRALSPHFVVNGAREANASREAIELLFVSVGTSIPSRASGAATNKKSCSANRFLCNPRVLLLDEPTRGVDVGEGDLARRRRFRRGGRRSCNDLFGNRRTPRRSRPHHGHARWSVEQWLCCCVASFSSYCYKIDLCFYGSQVVLGAPLQQEAAAKR